MGKQVSSNKTTKSPTGSKTTWCRHLVCAQIDRVHLTHFTPVTRRSWKTENADTLKIKWTPMKEKQQTQEPAECEQLFLARSRHGNSSSLQSRADVSAIRASDKTQQRLAPLLFPPINFSKRRSLFGSMCDFVPKILKGYYLFTGVDWGEGTCLKSNLFKVKPPCVN